jgi:hypothetical protein
VWGIANVTDFINGMRARLQRRMRKAFRRKRVPSKARMVPPIRRAGAPKGYLALAAIVKNEASYLLEWIEFHRLVGIEHIYLYDNGSTDNTPSVVEPYVAQRFVTLMPWSSFDATALPQYQAYAHALCNFGPYWRWLSFIDADEFIFPLQSDSLQDALTAYEDLPVIALQWHMFGTSGHKVRPEGLVIENYTRRARLPTPRHGERLCKWKSIVDPTQVNGVISPHTFSLLDGRLGAFDENRQWFNREERVNAPSRIFRLNHYFTKSEEELAAKVAKGSACRRPTDNSRPKGWALERADLVDADTVLDEEILRFVTPLRQRLAVAEKAGPSLAELDIAHCS